MQIHMKQGDTLTVVTPDATIWIGPESWYDDILRSSDTYTRLEVVATNPKKSIDVSPGTWVQTQHADDQDALTLFERHHQQIHGGIDALELLIRDQPRQAFIQFSLGLHAPCRVKTRQQGWHFAQKRQGFRQWTRFDAHKQVESL